MILVVHVPSDATDESAGALSLARRAPLFATEWIDGVRMAVATFPSLPSGIDLAVELVGDAVRLPEAWASVNATPLSSLTKLWQRLICYRDSLGAVNPVQYCLDQSAHFHALAGCEGHQCPVPCQFMCTPCLELRTQEARLILPGKRYKTVAAIAEIDWCPRLRIQ
jgi:hypothetical protein